MSISPSLNTILDQGTATGLRISSADGFALLDNCPAAITNLVALYPGRLNILILDASGKAIEAWAGAVGTAEAFTDLIGGTNPALNNGDFESDEPPGTTWSRSSVWTISGGLANTASSLYSGQAIYQIGLPIVAYGLYKTVFSISSITSGAVFVSLFCVGPNVTGTARASVAEYTQYLSMKSDPSSGFGIYAPSSAFAGSLGRAFLQQVTAPSSSGITLVSTRGGSTANVVSQATGFVHNAASYRWVVRGQRIVSNIGSWIK